MATIVELGQKVKAKYPGQYDDLSDEELGRRVKQKYPDDYADFSDKTIPVSQHTRRRPQKAQDGQTATTQAPSQGNGIGSLLPAAGGFVGGMAGKALGAPTGPGAYAAGVGGAALGGTVGESIRQAMEDPRRLVGLMPMEMERIGAKGVEQAAYEATGGVIGKGLRVGGRFAMQMAMKLTPAAAQTAIREGITATGKGIAKLKARIIQAAGAETAIVRAAAGRGTGWIEPGRFGQEVFQEVAKKLEGAPTSELGRLSSLLDEFLRDNAQAISPVKMLKMRRYYDSQTQSLKAMVKRGGKPKGEVEQLWNEAVSNHARRTLQAEIPAIVDPAAYAKLTGKATLPSELQLVREGLFPATRKPGTWAAIGGRSVPFVVGAGVGAAAPADDLRERGAQSLVAGLVAAGLTTPQALSMISLLMTNPAMVGLMSQTPRAAGALLEE